MGRFLGKVNFRKACLIYGALVVTLVTCNLLSTYAFHTLWPFVAWVIFWLSVLVVYLVRRRTGRRATQGELPATQRIQSKSYSHQTDSTANEIRRDEVGVRVKREGGSPVRSGATAMVGVLCPYCLERDSISKVDQNEERQFTCDHCNMRVPPEYMKNARIPREVISAVGFRGHGKTVYFASLFHTMNALASFWPGFYTFAIDEKSLDIVKQNSKLLKTGELPAATPMNFPIPTIVRFSNMPSLGDRFFLFYDTSGEAYARQSALIQYASFVRRSRAVIFLLSLDDLEHDDQKMHELLSTYVQGLTELDGNTKNQHLIVVLSKGDRMEKRLEGHEDIWQYLEDGRLDKLGNEKLGNYINGMKRVSRNLRDFVRDDLGEAQFLNFAGDRFKSVEFSIVSALGAEPTGNRLQAEITPKRIIDPILWVVYKSKGLFQKGNI